MTSIPKTCEGIDDSSYAHEDKDNAIDSFVSVSDFSGSVYTTPSGCWFGPDACR
jgi:hypothetical protein